MLAFAFIFGAAVPCMAGASMDDTIKQWAENSVKFDAAVPADKKEGASAVYAKRDGRAGALVKQVQTAPEKGGADLKGQNVLPPKNENMGTRRRRNAEPQPPASDTDIALGFGSVALLVGGVVATALTLKAGFIVLPVAALGLAGYGIWRSVKKDK